MYYVVVKNSIWHQCNEYWGLTDRLASYPGTRHHISQEPVIRSNLYLVLVYSFLIWQIWWPCFRMDQTSMMSCVLCAQTLVFNFDEIMLYGRVNLFGKMLELQQTVLKQCSKWCNVVSDLSVGTSSPKSHPDLTQRVPRFHRGRILTPLFAVIVAMDFSQHAAVLGIFCFLLPFLQTAKSLVQFSSLSAS